MKQVIVKILIMTVCFLAPALIVAQPPDDFPGGRMPGHQDGHWGKMSANMENLRFLKMLEALDLDDEQSQTFVPLYHSFRRDIKALHTERREIFEQLEELVKKDNVDAEILKTLDKLKENDVSIEKRKDQLFEECSSFFSVPQLARLAIFQERFERDILKALRDFRGHGGPDDQEKRQGKI